MKQQLSRLCTLALVVVAVSLSLWAVRPPATVPATAPVTEFSSERAMAHVRAIAREPHPVGSDPNHEVREYLASELMDLCHEVQVHKGYVAAWGPEPLLVQNVVARLNGTDGDPAILLLSHYDSVPEGPGAADDAAGVAAVLETLRAIRASSPLKRDIIVLITDGEEAGLLGAHRFVSEHPWLEEVALVMNFEARGRGGPSVLMQTGHENGKIVREFARAAPHPFGSSFAEDVFRRMPNDTDFTVFRNAGKTGLNFAFFKGLRYYHTELDNIENLDQRSLQHHGSYCLALARHFGNLPLNDLHAPDRVFFDLLGSVLVHYPLSWSRLVSMLAATAFLVALVIGIRNRRLRFAGIIVGMIAFVIVAVLGAAGAFALWSVASRFMEGATVSRGDVTWADSLSFGTLLVVIAAFGLVHALIRGRIGVQDRTAGALVPWFVLALFAGWFVPRGHHLFAWPLLSSSLGLLILARVGFQECVGWRWAACCVLTLPSIALMSPSVYLIAVTVGASLNWATALCIAPLVALLTAQLDWIMFGQRTPSTEPNGPLPVGS